MAALRPPISHLYLHALHVILPQACHGMKSPVRLLVSIVRPPQAANLAPTNKKSITHYVGV